jgi:hemolysin D
MLNATEAEFLPAALALQSAPVSPVTRLLAKVMMALFAAIITWSVFGKMDIVVNAQGKIIPSGYTKTIASIDVASVKKLYVDEGQSVKAGDVLIELDTSASDAEEIKANGDRSAAMLQVARSKALINAIDTGYPPQLVRIDGVNIDSFLLEQAHVNGQYRDFSAKLKRIEDDIVHYSEALPLAIQQSQDYAEMEKNKDVSHHAWIEKEQIRVELEGQLRDAKDQRVALIEEARRIAYDQLAEGERIAAASHQDALRSGAHSKLLRLTAPVDGTVQQLTVHTVGGIVEAAKPLMLIVPIEKKVAVEAFLENRDVGFVVEGQAAHIKVDAFDYSKYGTITGEVSHVSRDAIDDEKKGLIYSTKINLDQNSINVNGRSTLLTAGMSVNVEIKTGERRIIEYVLSPLVHHARESLNER